MSTLSVVLGGWTTAFAQVCTPQWGTQFYAGDFDSVVLAMEWFDDGVGTALYASGSFTTAGGVDANRIAKWDGSTWSPLGEGMDGSVVALIEYDDGTGPALYAGGGFTTAGGVYANRIAKWDGSTWSSLGTGMNGSVVALTVFDDGFGPALYAGGLFTTAGGVEANSIARWDGSTWSPLGSGLGSGFYGDVRALAVHDDGSGPALFAGGSFTTSGETEFNRIARWDGVSWWPLGTGMNSGVNALSVFDDGVGGDFTRADEMSSGRIARWGGPLADLDRDGETDLNDWKDFSLCFAGPGNPPAEACPDGIDADLDCDDEVDLFDYSIFQRSITRM